MKRALVVALVIAGGCSNKSADPCAGLSGTCVAVTVTSTQVARVDSLVFTASGAVMGTQQSSATAASLPIHVALRLPAGAAGPLDVAVEGLLGGNVVGAGSGSTNVTAGAHSTLPIALDAIGSGDGGEDMAGTIEDLSNADLTGVPSVILPTAPVAQSDLDAAGLTPLSLPAGESLLNADTGEISNSIRTANNVFGNREINGGIAFRVAGGVGIFTFASLTVPQGATLKIIGTQPAALVSADTIVVNGLVEARPMDVTGAVCVLGSKGAGGGAGGGPGSAMPPYVGGVKGVGMGGGGGGGRKGNGTLSSCGGGAGHGDIGGTAPPAMVMDTPGGGGGVAYDTADLVSYHGGSGGGGNGAPPGTGGGGGGAIQLVAKTAITIGIGTVRAGLNAGGCGGKGCSGGGSGGAILVEAPAVQLGAMATLAANGGGGGGSDSGGTMRDGNDATLDDQPALGGGTAPFNARGGNGGAGATAVGQDPQQGTGQYSGGGAVGRIRINTKSGMPSMATGSILSPYASTTATTFGTITLQ